jgi:hypothetical protein
MMTTRAAARQNVACRSGIRADFHLPTSVIAAKSRACSALYPWLIGVSK